MAALDRPDRAGTRCDAVAAGPPPPPVAAWRAPLDRTERIAAVVTLVLAAAFVGLVGMAHAEVSCREVVEVWGSGASEVVGTTCDGPSAPADGGSDGPGHEPDGPGHEPPPDPDARSV